MSEWYSRLQVFKRHRVLTAGFSLMLALGILSALFADRQIIINTSPSVRPGLYMRSSSTPSVGSIVDFSIPMSARAYVRARTGCAGEEWYILKPIAAGPGDYVDTSGDWLMINGHRMAPMPPASDSDGRPLPIWRGARLLSPGEYFVFSDRIPNSFDSRCYGPIAREGISAVRTPLITW